MPLSKARNRARMRKARLHKQLLSLAESKPVQPKTVTYDSGWFTIDKNNKVVSVDADGNPIPDFT